MRGARQPSDEALRLAVLRRYDLLDTMPEQSFDDIARLAAYICDAPIAHISLVDEHRQWFKSEIGTTLKETPRDEAFCSHTIDADGLFIVSDAQTDARFSDNPLVTGDTNIRFYAGAPLVTPDGVAVGALCVLDRVPRELTDRQQEALRVLSRQVLAQMELRRQSRELIATEAAATLAAVVSERAERDFRRLFAANPLVMWIYDQATLQFLEVNDAAVARYGYTRDEFLSMSIKDIRPFEDVERLLRGIAKPRDAWLEAGGWRHILKSGNVIDVEITSHELIFTGRPAVLVVAQDVTERQRAQGALRASEDRYRKLFNASPDGLVIADQVSTYIDGNASICRMLGYDRNEFVGLNAKSILVPEDQQYIDVALSALKAATDFHRDLQFRRKDGTVFVAEVIATPLPDGTYLGIIRDVTERRTLEQQYQQAQKMEAIGRLAGGVAHDFNNLLTAILGYCELLLADLPEDDVHRADLQEIENAGLRAAGLTRQLLAFSRREIIAPALLDLNDVVVRMQSMLRRLIGEDIEVQIKLHEPLPLLKADRGQLEQILMNLAVNARDAMPKGGVLTIETTNVALNSNFQESHVAGESGPYVSLTVSDTGTGMTPEVQSRLFEPFFTTKEIGKGTGLGLATVHGIVKRSAGALHVQSKLGEGSSITAYFPVATADEPIVEVHPITRPHVGAETVLVVEDEDGLRELIRRLLHRQGYVVYVAANADEALRVFDTIDADVLLTDVVMPGGSGPDLTKRLVAQRPGLKVLFMSGYTEDDIVHHGVLEPDIAFMHKPFSSDTLSRKLREVLDR